MSNNDTNSVRTWIEIDVQAIHNNLREFRKIIKPPIKIASVIKSNAYGHDFVPFAQEMQKGGIDWLIVDSYVEAKALRRNDITKPILVLGHTLPENYIEAADKNISLTVSNKEILRSFANFSFNTPLRIHIKIDTGMCRQGFMRKETEEVLEVLSELGSSIQIEGLYTHFSSAKNPNDSKFTLFQIDNFLIWKEAFHEAGFSPLVHAAATSGSLLFPQAHFDMVRIGIGMYGLWPSKEVEKYAEKHLNLKSVLTWKSIVAEVKTIPKNSVIGYDGIEFVDKKMTIAIVPIGYWHGYPRNMSSVGKVLVHGEISRILGRVSMDMIIVDVSKIKNILIGDEVVLIGKQEKKEVSATQFADLAQTVNYEIITRLNPKIRRIYK